jgi:hypothetical protein
VPGPLAEVATKALNAVWCQKWIVHHRPRPEAIGDIVHLIKTGHGDKTDVTLSPVLLNSRGLRASFNSMERHCFRRRIFRARQRTRPTRLDMTWSAAPASQC